MNNEEIVKSIYSLRDDILKNSIGIRDFRLKIDILNQINSIFFVTTSIPEILVIQPNKDFSLNMFENAILGIIHSLNLEYTFFRKEVVGSSTKYIFKLKNSN